MVVLNCCCCENEENLNGYQPRSKPAGGTSAPSNQPAVVAPTARAMNRSNEYDDSDLAAVQWMRNRSLSKSGHENPLSQSGHENFAHVEKHEAVETESSRLPPNPANPKAKRAKPAPEKPFITSQNSRSKIGTSKQPHFDKNGFRSEVQNTKPAAVSSRQEESGHPRVVIPNNSRQSSTSPQSVSTFSKSWSPSDETAQQRSMLPEEENDNESIGKKQYVAAIQLLHRTLIQKEKKLTVNERDFLKDLLENSLNEAPSLDQLSAVESATERLQMDPLFTSFQDDSDLPQSPSVTLQRTSPPRPNPMKEQDKDASDDFFAFIERQTYGGGMDVENYSKTSQQKSMASTSFEDDMGMEVAYDEDGFRIEEDETDSPNLPQQPTPSDDSSFVRYDGWFGLDQDKNVPGVFDERSPFRILGTSPEDRPRVLTPLLMEALRGFLPYAVSEENFWLKFSLVRDGASLQTLLHRIRASSWTVICVETMDGDVFGSFTGSPWRRRGGWFGSSESFLWRLKHSRIASPQAIAKKPNFENEMEVYPFTGHDKLVQHCTGRTIAVGGGDYESQDSPYEGEPRGIGFMLDDDLAGGESNSCATFANPRLCQRKTSAEFDVSNVEVWTLTPCLSVEEAQKLELGKLFVEEHKVK